MVTGTSYPLRSDPPMRRAVFSLLALTLVLRAQGAEAFHYITPTLVQIPPVATNPGTIEDARWGGLRYVLFDSDADLAGTGSTGRQVFLFDLQIRDVTGVLALTQLTTGSDDKRRPHTGRRATTVVYDSQPGGVGPRQIMVLDRHHQVHALTAGGADSVNPNIDDNERTVVFESAADFFGTGTTGTQIYEIDLRRADLTCPFPCAQNGNTGLTMITNKSGNSRNASTTSHAKTIVFESDADLLNVNENQSQIYLYDGKSQQLSLLSHGPGASRNPSMTSNGGRILFESDADPLGSGTGGTQIFLHSRDASTLQQITSAANGACTNPSVSSNGHAVAFVSADDLLGMSKPGPQVYSYNLKKHYLIQVTNAQTNISNPAYASGVFTVFLSDGDLEGNGSPGTQLYLVNLYALGTGTVQPPGP